MTDTIDHSFVHSGRDIRHTRVSGDQVRQIPAGVWLVKFDQQRGEFFLTQQDPMSLPSKTYGTTNKRADKILKTFMSRKDRNTGVLLTGNKGSGKTLLTKETCIKAMKIGMPVLIITDPFVGTTFFEYMNGITQPCVVLIDEFEKVYRREEEQNGLLSLLDGTGANNKLFLLTSNSENVSEFLLSRPSRLFYHWRYGKLEEDVLVGYCKDNLTDQKHLKNLTTLWGVSSDMSFDVLQSIVEELNRYPNADFVDLICNMNVSLGDALNRRFEFKSATFNGEAVKDYHGSSTANINMVTFQEGNYAINCSLTVPKYSDQVDMYEALGASKCYFYNKDILEAVNKGERDGNDNEALDQDIDVEFVAQLSFRQESDRILPEDLVFTRDIKGRELKVVYTLVKQDTAMTYFRRMFD